MYVCRLTCTIWYVSIYMYTCTSSHTAELKAFWLSSLHIRIPTYWNQSLFYDKFVVFLLILVWNTFFWFSCLIFLMVPHFNFFHYKLGLFCIGQWTAKLMQLGCSVIVVGICIIVNFYITYSHEVDASDAFFGVYSVLSLVALAYYEVNALGLMDSKNRRLRLQ